MDLEVHCEYCGKQFPIPRDAAGRQHKCPTCGNSVYVPTPADELEELPLASEDTGDRRHEDVLQAERRRLERILSGEKAAADGAPAKTSPTRQTGAKLGVQALIVAYLQAMGDAQLPLAEEYLSQLQNRRTEARRVADRLISDQLPPRELGDVPAGVYQGFLKSLRAKL